MQWQSAKLRLGCLTQKFLHLFWVWQVVCPNSEGFHLDLKWVLSNIQVASLSASVDGLWHKQWLAEKALKKSLKWFFLYVWVWLFFQLIWPWCWEGQEPKCSTEESGIFESWTSWRDFLRLGKILCKQQESKYLWSDPRNRKQVELQFSVCFESEVQVFQGQRSMSSKCSSSFVQIWR